MTYEIFLNKKQELLSRNYDLCTTNNGRMHSEN